MLLVEVSSKGLHISGPTHCVTERVENDFQPGDLHGCQVSIAELDHLGIGCRAFDVEVLHPNLPELPPPPGLGRSCRNIGPEYEPFHGPRAPLSRNALTTPAVPSGRSVSERPPGR